MARQNYEALNAQLLDELPQLDDLAVEVTRHVLNLLVQAQASYYGQALAEMYTLLGVGPQSHSLLCILIKRRGSAHIALTLC